MSLGFIPVLGECLVSWDAPQCLGVSCELGVLSSVGGMSFEFRVPSSVGSCLVSSGYPPVLGECLVSLGCPPVLVRAHHHSLSLKTPYKNLIGILSPVVLVSHT